MSESDAAFVHPRPASSSTPEGGAIISSSSSSTPPSSSNPPSSSIPLHPPTSLIQRAVEACQKGNEDELDKCLREGIKASDLDGDGCGLLHWAAINNHQHIIFRLLQEGADVNQLGGILVSAPLHWAARVGNLNACAILARSGARADIRDTQGYTPIHLAIQGCFTHIIAYFIHHYDYAINVADNSGMTPSMWCGYRNFDIFPLRLLVKAGADLSIKETLMGNTALHFAAQERNFTAVKELISGGADIMAKNNQLETPLDIARNTRNTKIIKLMEKYGRRNGSIHSNCIQSIHDNDLLIKVLQFFGPSISLCSVYLLFYFLHPLLALVIIVITVIILRLQVDIHSMQHSYLPLGITVAEALSMLATWSFSQHWWVPWWTQIMFIFFMSTLIATFIRCALFDAGTIPPSKRPYEEFKQIVDEKRLTYFCYSCFVNRPHGSKHCSVCDKCVLSFDHHCPWLGSCITRRNQREFLLFVLSVGITSIIFDTSIIIFFTQYLKDHELSSFFYHYPWLVFTFLLAGIHVMLMSSLFFMQSWQIAKGVTTNQLLKKNSYPRQTVIGTSQINDEESGRDNVHYRDDSSNLVFYIRNCLNFCAGH